MRKLQFRAQSKPCAYCGAPSETKDHVVAECFFVPPLPNNMLTVRACTACNQAKALFDTFMRDAFTVDLRAQGHPDARAIFWGPMLRSAITRRSTLVPQVQQRGRLRDLVTPGELFAGIGVEVELTGNEIETGLTFIVRGLTYRIRRVRLPDNATVNVISMSPEQAEELWHRIQAIDPILRPYIMGNDICAWVHLYADPYNAAWLLVFYGRLCFGIKVGPARPILQGVISPLAYGQ